ncbi:hypothetical protein N8I84_32895 [Streptomyces cynarae]|uniref:Uncharacterized protein n=1 Tax=Streptomyces cynarae TaxID=2981134 RepID=A0ABY6E8F0_9ACTN|nr:hypothetical protein [Streptomyces cynarae]UXY22966.1 hypothetical protein N8I84_32895 [Streptomyces cynarae]
MGSFDEFVRFSAKLSGECIGPNSLAALSGFSLISVHVGPDPIELVMTFESPNPDDDSELNAVRFSVVFEQVSDLAICGYGYEGPSELITEPTGKHVARFGGMDSYLSFRFGAVGVAGVRRFKMAWDA